MDGIVNPFKRLGRFWKALVFVMVLAGMLAPAAPVGAYSSPDPATGTDESDFAASTVTDLFPGKTGSNPQNLTVIGAAVFFSAAGDNTGFELWMSLPPYTDEILVADVNFGDDSSFPENFVVHGDSLFFTAEDDEHGRELWVSEPPFNSARLVADINPGRDSSNPHQLTPLGNDLFFAADDGSHGIELWKTQSPFNTAQMVADIFVGGPSSNPDNLTTIGWNLFYAATNSYHRELWMSSPPYTSAQQVSKINSSGAANPQELTPVDGKLFFTAADPNWGTAMFLTESPFTPESTRPLNDFDVCVNFDPDELEMDEFAPYCWQGSSPYDLYAIGDTLFFTANIGLIGFEPWKTLPPYDPTTTNRVADVNDVTNNSGSSLAIAEKSSFAKNKTSIGSILFFSAYKPVDGYELWRSEPPYNDDTTFQVADVNSGPGTSDPMQLTPAGRTLFFTAIDPDYGREVWLSQAPYTSAQLLQDIWPGPKSSDPNDLVNLGDLLFFNATNRDDGAELWKVLTGWWLPNTGFAPGVVTPLQPQPAAKAYQATNLQLSFPRLGVQVPIVGVPALDAGWDLAWLDNKAGYLEGTAFPTWTGNTVLTGHAYLQNGYPGPFAQLENLRYGDSVVVEAWGQRYVYQVRSNEQVSPQDMSVFQHEDLDWLTLITCKGWDEATNQYESRIVVRAVRVGVE